MRGTEKVTKSFYKSVLMKELKKSLNLLFIRKINYIFHESMKEREK